MVKEIPQKHIALIDDLQKTDKEFKEKLRETFATEVKEIKSQHQKLFDSNVLLLEKINIEQDALRITKNAVQEYLEHIKSINFPERLDKLDANVTGIMSAVQSTQSRLDSVERHIMDRLG